MVRGVVPSTWCTTRWVPAASDSGRSTDELSGAQISWLSAYWSKYVRNWSMNRVPGTTTGCDWTLPPAASTKNSRTSVSGAALADGVATTGVMDGGAPLTDWT